MRLSPTLVLFSIFLALVSCAPLTPNNSASTKDTALSTDLDKNIRNTDFVLLGEKHDNPKHHIIQNDILKTYLSEGDLVVFEMLNSEQQPAIENYLEGTVSFNDLPAKLNWQKSGWPDWSYYGPLFKTAKANGAQILFGSYPKPVLMKQTMLKIARPKVFSDELMVELDEQIRISHCQMLPDEMVRPMSNLQVIKDDLMAKQLATKSTTAKAFLIAGNGHVRRDRGVPAHLRFMNKESIFVLGLIEESSEPDEWELFSTFDTIWITENLGKTMEDYCQRLKERFKKKAS